MFTRTLRLGVAVAAASLVTGSALAQAPAPGAPAPAAGAPPAAAAPALPPPSPLQEAMLKAANDLFSKATLPAGDGKVTLVVDPLIDGVVGAQSNATAQMERQVIALVKSKYPRFDVKPFNSTTVAEKPVVFIGTFTPINAAGIAGGAKDAYRICFALADLKSNTLISKGFARATTPGVDPTPTAFFQDSPVFATDDATLGYIRSCQGTKAGDPINKAYADRIQVAALVNDGISAYNARRYADANKAYSDAQKLPGGDQLRVLNGLYLTNLKLNKPKEASEAFGQVVDYGLKQNKIGVKFLFAPNQPRYMGNQPYPIWINAIASRAKDKCLDVVGHTSTTGTPAINERLSLQRAQYVVDRLKAANKDIATKLKASGVGPKEALVGTGRDDASDALDRRVEFKVGAC